MLDKFKKLESILRIVKENLALIILVPTIFGGAWQTFELIFIDLSFVRFFSPSQLISDGLVILCVFAVLFILYLFFTKKLFKTFLAIDIKDSNYSLGKIILSLVVIFFSGGYFIFVAKMTRLFENNFSVNYIFFIGLLIIICLPLILYGIREIIIQLIKRDLNKSKILFETFRNQISSKSGSYYHMVRLFSKILSFLTLFLTLFIFIGLLKFRDLIIYPDKLENVKFVFEKIHKDYGKNVKPTLLYFNDKYLFVELQKEDDSIQKSELDIRENQIVVYKTEDIFFKK